MVGKPSAFKDLDVGKNRFLLAVLLGIAVAAPSGLPVQAAAPKSGPSACTVSLTTLFLRQGDKDFNTYLAQTRSYFAIPGAKGPTGRWGKPTASGKAETLQIDLEKSACINPQNNGSQTAVGGCNYVGCTGSLGSDYDGLPKGSSVTISICGGGVKSTGTFVKNGSGQWAMTSYSESVVPSQESCPVGPE